MCFPASDLRDLFSILNAIAITIDTVHFNRSNLLLFCGTSSGSTSVLVPTLSNCSPNVGTRGVMIIEYDRSPRLGRLEE